MSRVRVPTPSKDTPEGVAFQKKALDARMAAKEEKELLTKVTRYLRLQLNDTNIEKFTKKLLESAVTDPNSRAGQFVLNVLYNEEDVVNRLHMLDVMDEAESGREISADETE